MKTPGLISVIHSKRATITLDDGRANTLDRERIAAFREELSRLGDCDSVVITGRPGWFCAGLDKRLLEVGHEDELEVTLSALAPLLTEILMFPRPVVCAVTGHAVAAGTLLAMCADHVVAANGSYSWGLTESRHGVAQRKFGLALARYRLGADADRWSLLGSSRTPLQALDSGVVHELVEPERVGAAAAAAALDLAAIPRDAFSVTKARLRSEVAQSMHLEIVTPGVAR